MQAEVFHWKHGERQYSEAIAGRVRRDTLGPGYRNITNFKSSEFGRQAGAARWRSQASRLPRGGMGMEPCMPQSGTRLTGDPMLQQNLTHEATSASTAP